jgi:hypothetical protein
MRDEQQWKEKGSVSWAYYGPDVVLATAFSSLVFQVHFIYFLSLQIYENNTSC